MGGVIERQILRGWGGGEAHQSAGVAAFDMELAGGGSVETIGGGEEHTEGSMAADEAGLHERRERACPIGGGTI